MLIRQLIMIGSTLVLFSAVSLVMAQDYDARDPVQALQQVLDFLGAGDDMPADAESWTVEDWSPRDWVGSGIQGFHAGGWRARLTYPIVPAPEYEVILAHGESPEVWTGTVDSEGSVQGAWRDIEADLLQALEVYLVEEGILEEAQDIPWERTPLDFDTQAASLAGYFPSFAAALYMHEDITAALWYDIEVPYNLALVQKGHAMWFQMDETGTLNQTSSAADGDEADVSAVQSVKLSEDIQALRCFVDYTNSCEALAPVQIGDEEILIKVMRLPGEDCKEYARYFEITFPAPADVARINGDDLEALSPEGSR